MFVLLLSAVLACSKWTPYTEEPEPRMGIRFTRRGLEKFCQKGYTIIPEILASMPVFQLPEINLGTLKLTFSNIRPRAVRVTTMRVYFLKDNLIKMEARDGMMQLSMRLEAVIAGIPGTVDCIFTLADFGGDISLKIGDDKSCPYHFGMFDIKSVVSFSRLNIDATGLDTGGSIIANTLQGMEPALEVLMKNTILSSLVRTIFTSLKYSMLDLPLVSQFHDYFTDQRYINGINIIDGKIVANQGGLSMIADEVHWDHKAPYPNPDPPHKPKTIYTNRDYELFFDREAINSYLYALHMGYYQFKTSSYPIKYSDIKSQNIQGLDQALKDAGILSENDPGTDITIILSVQPSKQTAPHIPWIGAALLPVTFKQKFVVAANRKSISDTNLTDVDSDTLFSSTFNLRKEPFDFANDQARAYLVLNELLNISIIKKTGYMDDPEPLLGYLIKKLYLPVLNIFISEPGACLMNGNFIDTNTITTIHLCDEDRVLFIADIEKNRYFS